MLKVVSLAIAMVLCAVGAAEGGAGMYFDMVDTDQNSKIDVNEIRGFMNTFGQMMAPESAAMSRKEKTALITEVMGQLDTNKDGGIDMAEAEAGEGFVFQLLEKFGSGGHEL